MLRGRGQVVREGQVEGSRAGGAGGGPRDGTADPTPSERPHTHASSGTLPRLCLRGSAPPGLSSPAGGWRTKGVGTSARAPLSVDRAAGLVWLMTECRGG